MCKATVVTQLIWLIFIPSLKTFAANQNNEIEELRSKWGAGEIVRNVDHIQEDVKKFLDFKSAGLISNDEILFYFLRMHDFDNNNKLDGLELMIALNHINHGDEDPTNHEMPFLDIERAVHTLLMYDINKDGFLSYYELRRQFA